MKKTQAIRAAQEAVGTLYRFGNGYKYNSFDEAMNTWRESNSSNYHTAQTSRANMLIQVARKKMGMEEVYLPYECGSWIDYV
jgi:hypothetical protein